MKKELSTQTKGDIAELKVICALMNKSCNVFKSCLANCRYDLIFESENKFYKVQVKSAKYHPDRGTINVQTRSTNPRTNEIRTYKGQIDYFGIYCPQLDKCYLIPEEDVPNGGTNILIRINPPKNNQTLKVNWAKDYEI
jgi:hypothetical protein